MVFSCGYGCGGTFDDFVLTTQKTAETSDNTSTSSNEASDQQQRQKEQHQSTTSSKSREQMSMQVRASASRRSGSDNDFSYKPQTRSRSSERWKKERSSHHLLCRQDSDEHEGGPSPSDDQEQQQFCDNNLCNHSSNHCDGFHPRFHVRATSDPFDTQEDLASDVEEYNKDNNNTVDGSKGTYDSISSAVIKTRYDTRSTSNISSCTDNCDKYDKPIKPLPSLPRYPVADTRNLNCWNEPPINIFHVRGPHYFSDKVKVTSAPYLLRSRGCDILLLDEKNPCEAEDRTHLILEGRLRREPTLMINFKFPWGFMILYFQIPQKLVPYMSRNNSSSNSKCNQSANEIIDTANDTAVHANDKCAQLTAPEKVLAAWLQGSDDYRNERLKLIPFVSEGPWVVRNMVGGRPALIGKKLPIKYTLKEAASGESSQQQPLLCVTLDIASSSAAAKKIVSVCRRYMSSLTVDIGFCVEPQRPEELPEQMLGSIRIHGADPLKASCLC